MRGRRSSGRGRCGRTGEAGTGADNQRGTEARCGLKRGAGVALDHAAGLRLGRVAAAVRCGGGGNNHGSVEERGGAGRHWYLRGGREKEELRLRCLRALL